MRAIPGGPTRAVTHSASGPRPSPVEPSEPLPPVRIDPEQLSPEALRGVLEEFVTRDGTDLHEAESKLRQVSALLARGAVELWFDPETRTCNLVATPGR